MLLDTAMCVDRHDSCFVYSRQHCHCFVILGPGKPKAGKYGDYQCDLPPITFESMLKHINETHKVMPNSQKSCS